MVSAVQRSVRGEDQVENWRSLPRATEHLGIFVQSIHQYSVKTRLILERALLNHLSFGYAPPDIGSTFSAMSRDPQKLTDFAEGSWMFNGR